MSYPRPLQLLVVEDEEEAITATTGLLDALQDKYQIGDVLLARSYDDASAFLASDQILHAVILDLGLPISNRGTAQDGLEPGMQLLEQAARRDEHPIPALLVLSGRLGLAKLSELQDRLRADFSYGQLANKGVDLLKELEALLARAAAYVEIGVHTRSPTLRWVRPLVPREDDQLRRCALSQPDCIGLDLEWWSCEEGLSSGDDPHAGGPTRVLMGRFVLGHGHGLSRPTFFKFEPAGNAPYAERDTSLLDQKLRHVKRCWFAQGRTRALLVTQSVTEGRPVSLDTFLDRDPLSVQRALPGLLANIVEQLDLLSGAVADRVPVNGLLWPHHDRRVLQQMLERRPDKGSSVLTLFDELRADEGDRWVRLRPCSHGDLNVTNVAIETDPLPSRAYIFDAAGISRAVNVRDLAYLEVTALLFTSDVTTSPTDACAMFYDNELQPSSRDDVEIADARIGNLRTLLHEIRRQVVGMADDHQIYPIIAFDVALMQLGGLGVQPTRNKITAVGEAIRLVELTASWVRRTGYSSHGSPALNRAQPEDVN